MIAALEVNGLSKRYGPLPALDNATLTVSPGEFVCVLGPSGSGKTTLFRCIARLVEPDAGQIHMGGAPYHQLRGNALIAARRNIGIVFQQFNLIRRRTAMENVLAGRLGPTPFWRVAAGCFSEQDRWRAEDALQAVGLLEKANQRADTLSGGQQQRVAIARAIAQESRLLLADEPVASLDPVTAVSILELMRKLASERHMAVLCTLHQPQYAERFAGRILEMCGGRIVSSRDTRYQPQISVALPQ